MRKSTILWFLFYVNIIAWIGGIFSGQQLLISTSIELVSWTICLIALCTSPKKTLDEVFL